MSGTASLFDGEMIEPLSAAARMLKESEVIAAPADVPGESDLPEGWTMMTLGAVCAHPQYGWTTSAKRGGTGLKLLRTTDISSGMINWDTVPLCDEEPENPEKYLLELYGRVRSRFVRRDIVLG